MGIQLHSDKSIDKQRYKYSSFFIFEPSKLTPPMNQPAIHDLLYFLRFIAFLFFIILDKVSERYVGALGQIEVVIKFDGKSKEDDLSQRKLWLSLYPVELVLFFLFGCLLRFHVKYLRGYFLFWWLFQRLLLFEFELSQIVHGIFEVVHLKGVSI